MGEVLDTVVGSDMLVESCEVVPGSWDRSRATPSGARTADAATAFDQVVLATDRPRVAEEVRVGPESEEVVDNASVNATAGFEKSLVTIVV